jgi:hypothetical protein
MSDTRLLSQDEMLPIRDLWHENSDGGIVLETQQNVEDVVDDCKARMNLHNSKANQKFKGDGFHRVGQIPLVIVVQLMREGIWHDDEALLKWLDDRDNEVFKTMPARLAK